MPDGRRIHYYEWSDSTPDRPPAELGGDPAESVPEPVDEPADDV